jgi:hypothetical protein
VPEGVLEEAMAVVVLEEAVEEVTVEETLVDVLEWVLELSVARGEEKLRVVLTTVITMIMVMIELITVPLVIILAPDVLLPDIR